MRFIQRRAFDDLPPDAIVMTEDEVINQYQTEVYNWKPTSELWALKFGPLAMGLFNLVPTYGIAAYYRRRVKLPESGQIVYYVVTSGLCGILSTLMHHVNVQSDIFLQKECVSCNYVRAAVTQAGVFGVYGVLASCFATAISANTLNTYPIAGFESWANVKETFRQYAKFSAKISHKLALYATVSALLTCAITRIEYQQFDFMNQNIRDREMKLRAYSAAKEKSTTKTN